MYREPRTAGPHRVRREKAQFGFGGRGLDDLIGRRKKILCVTRDSSAQSDQVRSVFPFADGLFAGVGMETAPGRPCGRGV